MSFNDFYNENKFSLWLIIISIILLLSMNYVSSYGSYSCNQESFNTSNQSGFDNCNNLDYSGYVINQSNVIIEVASTGLDVVYYKPSLNISSVDWNIYTYYNKTIINIPSDCYDYNESYIRFKIRSIHNYFSGQGILRLSCYNSTSIKIINEFNDSSPPNSDAYVCNSYIHSLFDGNNQTGIFGNDVGGLLKTWCNNTNEINFDSLGQGAKSSVIMEESVTWNVCDSLWIMNNTDCNGFNYTIQYFDYYNCNIFDNIPLDNNIVVNCSVSIDECSDNLCINPVYANSSCCIVTPVVYCSDYTYELYNNNAVLIDSGVMMPFVNDTFYFMFNQDIGTYYAKICDDSTRQLIVEGDNMIGLTSDTWLLITLILLFILFLWLSIKIDILFLVLNGIIFMYVAYYSYTLYSSWFVTTMMSMVGLLFILFGVLGKIGEK